MPQTASDINTIQVSAESQTALTEACRRVFNEAVRLETHLERSQDTHIAQIRGRANQILDELDEQFSQDGELEEIWSWYRQVLRDLIEHVILNSSWAAGLVCVHCKENLNLSRLPPGIIEEIAQKLDEPYQAASMLTMLALRNREPHALYAGHWGKLAKEVLQTSEPVITEEDFPTTAPCPKLPAVMQQRSTNIEPLNSDVTPVGLAGEAWNILEEFYQEHRITWKGLPLNLLLGETGSGKTELVRASDLPFAPVNGEPRKNLNFTWWYAAKQGVILETPGGFTSENADESESAQWQHMLELLSTRTPRPIDSLTLTVNLATILKSNNQADELAERLRALLQQVSRGLGVRFPVYLVFTHCETLFGFTEFARSLTPAQYRQSLAWVPNTALTESLDPEKAKEGIAAMAEHFQNLAPHILIRAENRVDAGRIYAFPQEFQQLQDPLADFLERLFTAYGSTPLYFFRGVWFTSSSPSGKPVQRALAFTPPAEETKTPLPDQWAQTPLYCDDLYEQRIFAEKNLVQMGPRERRSGAGMGSLSMSNILSRILGWFQSLTGWRRDVVFVLLLVLIVWASVEAWRLYRVLSVTRVLREEPRLEMNFNILPAGEFIMGSPTSDLYRDGDETPHWREIEAPFYLAEFEVTQAQWFEVMGYNPSFYKDPDYPVDSVSWEDCKDFIDKLNLQTKEGQYALPTEKQWEYAARGGTQETLPAEPENSAWYAVNSKQRTHPVGFKAAGHWGIYDMYGNVSEWVQDWYRYDYIPIQDPKGPPEGTEKVKRGGAFFDQLPTLRASRRISGDPNEASQWVGLRLVWIPNPHSKTGRYLAEHPERISGYYKARKWAGENSELLGSLAGDLGGWVSDNWDALWALVLGDDAEAPPQDAVEGAADAINEAIQNQ